MVDYYQDRWDKKKGVVILDEACNDRRTRRSLEPQRGGGQEDLCKPQILSFPFSFAS